MSNEEDPYPAFPPDPDPYEAPPPDSYREPLDIVQGLAAAGDAFDYWATHYETHTNEGDTLVERGEDDPAWKWWGGRILDFFLTW